jgi:hypothetical protein
MDHEVDIASAFEKIKVRKMPGPDYRTDPVQRTLRHKVKDIKIRPECAWPP